MERRININDFVLEKYTEFKVPEEILEVIFDVDTQFIGDSHGQQKCKNLLFPFSRTPLQEVGIKNSTMLLDSSGDSTHIKNIREITLCVKHLINFEWQPGDTIGILPYNSNESVNGLLQLLNLESVADKKCSVRISKICKKKTAKVPGYIPSTTTPREILRDCINHKSALKKQFLRSLAEYCSDNKEKEFLKSLSSKEGTLFYNKLIMVQGLTLVDILKLCSSCKPPLSLIIENLSRLLPRPYSIANSTLKSKSEITLIFTILNEQPGITTSMLNEKCIKESSSVLMYLREPNYFRYTEEDYDKNQILIAIGVGLAPFLGFLQHKEYMMMDKENAKKAGNTWLFVGATSKQAVIHRQQLLKWESQNVMNKFEEAYSREKTARYHYIQDSLEDNSKELVEFLMKPETVLYICADGGQISKCLENSLKNILVKELAINEEKSFEIIKDFKTTRKYREDIWI